MSNKQVKMSNLKLAICKLLLIVNCSLFISPGMLIAGSNAIVLRSQDLSAYNLAIDGFISECDKNDIVVKSIEDMAGSLENGKKIIAKYSGAKDKPDLFLAVGVLAATLVRKTIKDVPVIFCMVVNYHRFHLEGTNISGVASEVPEKDCLKIYKDIIVDLKDIGVIYDPAKTENMIENGRKSLSGLGLNLVSVNVKSDKEVKTAIKNIIDQIDGLWLVPDSTVINENTFSFIFDTTVKNRVPILCTSDAFVKAGALVAVFPDYTGIGVEAGKIAVKILKQGNIDSLYVKYPTKLKIAVNLETASKIKVKIPENIKKLYDVVEYQ